MLVGHSLGALYVRSFAQAYPDRTTALVLVDPSHPVHLPSKGPALGHVQLLLDDPEVTQPDVRESLEVIESELRRLIDILKRLQAIKMEE